MKIAVASDHAGYNYKSEIIKHLTNLGYEIIDCGTHSLDSCDYPIFAKEAANKVANKEAAFGVLVCSSGEGIMIAANKVKGIRCGIGYDDVVTEYTRRHNDANMISFGANYMKLEDVIRRVDNFLNTPFEGGRHQRRVNEIEH